MKALCAAALVGLTVASCENVRQREMQARMHELNIQSLIAAQTCDVTFPAGNPTTAVVRAKCQTEALAIRRPVVPDLDLMELFIAKRLAIAEQVQKGQLTVAQGNELIAATQSEIGAEEQRRAAAKRSAAAQSAAAQEGIATATLSVAGPHSCTRIGNTVNCL